MNENEITPEVSNDVAEETPRTRNPKRRKLWITAAVIAAVIAGGAGIGVPLAVQAADHNAAVSSFTSASDGLASASAERADAQKQLDTRVAKAKTEYESYVPFTKAVADDLLTDGDGSNAALSEALTAYAKAAGLSIDDAGAVTVTAVKDEVVPVAPAIAEATSEIRDQATELVADTKTVDSQAAGLEKKTSTIDTANTSVLDAITVIEKSAAAKGATLTFEGADAATVDAVHAAAAALVADGAADKPVADRLASLTAYSAAVQAARDSAAAAAAAKAQAEADAAAKSSGGSYSSGNGSSKSSSSSKSSGSTGSSGSSGSSGGSGPSGGTSGGGGSSGSSGGSSGSSGTQYTSANRGKIGHSTSTCASGAWGGGSSGGYANWASTINIPSDAVNVSVWEDPANNKWGVSFKCQNEDW